MSNCESDYNEIYASFFSQDCKNGSSEDKCAFDFGRHCSALITKHCENCSFKKTKTQLAEGRERAMGLLDRLPKQERDAILVKYYGHHGEGSK